MSLSLRFGLAAIGVLVLVVIGVSFQYERARLVENEASRQEFLRLHAQRAAHEIQHQVERLISDALFLTRTPPLQRLRRASMKNTNEAVTERSECYRHLEQLFFSLAYTRPWYFQLRLIDIENEGRELVRIDRRGGEVVATPSQEFQPKGYPYYVQEALDLAEGQVRLSRIDLNREHGRISLPETITLRATTPVMDSTGRQVALVVINLDMQRVFAHTARMVPAGDRLYLANEEGWFLLHPDPQKTMGFDRARPYDLGQEFPHAANRLARIEAVTGRHFATAMTGDIQPAYAVRLALDSSGQNPRHLTLVLAAGSSSSDHEFGAARRHVYLVIIALIGLAALLMALLIHTLTRSLRALVQVSKAVTRGDYRVQVPHSSLGDLHQLTRAFRHMTASLQERESRLQELNQTLEQRVAQRTGELEASREELARERGLLQSVVDHIGDGVVAVDSVGRFLLWNGRAEAMLGMGPCTLPASDWPGHYGLMRSPAGELLPVQELPIVRALAGETVRSQEFFVHNDHNAPGHWIGVNARPVTGASGAPEGAVAVLVNMDDARRLREMRDKRSGELARIGRLTLIGQIVDTTAHRLSQPLAAIANYAGAATQLLATGRIDSGQLENILTQVSRMAERGGETLDALRTLTHRDTPPYGTADINRAILSALELLSDRLQRLNIHVEPQLGPGIPGVCGQEIELQQAVMHLLINAIESLADKDGIQRRLHVHSDFDPSDQRIHIRVEDNGPGVAAGLEERIFEPWFTTRKNALGLGLAVVRSILERHKGNLHMAHNGEGVTRFIIELPVGGATND